MSAGKYSSDRRCVTTRRVHASRSVASAGHTSCTCVLWRLRHATCLRFHWEFRVSPFTYIYIQIQMRLSEKKFQRGKFRRSGSDFFSRKFSSAKDLYRNARSSHYYGFLKFPIN